MIAQSHCEANHGVILNKIWALSPLSSKVCEKGNPIYYRTTGGRYFKIVTNYSTGSTKEKAILFDKKPL